VEAASKKKSDFRTSDAGRKMKGERKDAYMKKIETLDAAVKTAQLNREQKENLSTVSLGTSKTNYLDPRITSAWCKKHEVPITRCLPKTLCDKFVWALGEEGNMEFRFPPDLN
jgi:DNA topoisomerase-1